MKRTKQSLAWLLLMLAAAVAVVFVASWLRPAHAHVHDRPELDSWFNNLQNAQGGICCINNRIEAVEIFDYKGPADDGSYEIELKGRWVHVNAGQVVTSANKYGAPLAWPKVGGNEVWCFIPGAGM